MSEEKIDPPIAREGKQPVPEILLQYTFKNQCRASVFQTNGKLAKVENREVYFDIEPSKKEDIETALHIGIVGFRDIGNHDSNQSRMDTYIPLSGFDKFIPIYLKWRFKNGK